MINITVGRQLFVDSFLIDPHRTAGVAVQYHRPSYLQGGVNPVLRPTQRWERAVGSPVAASELSMAVAYSGGVWWDPSVSLYKAWYGCGPTGRQCYAFSVDGLHWEKPALDVVPGTNIVLNETADSTTVWLDLDEVNPAARYKMAAVLARHQYQCYTILLSGDGIHWRVSNDCSGKIADRSTVFKNSLRSPALWVYSIKSYPPPDKAGQPFGRSRAYWESAELGEGANWSGAPGGPRSPLPWTNADVHDPRWACGSGEPPSESPGYNYTQLVRDHLPEPYRVHVLRPRCTYSSLTANAIVLRVCSITSMPLHLSQCSWASSPS